MNAVAQIMEMRATGAVPLAYVQTYGCQQNVADGEKIKGQLAEMGFAFTEIPMKLTLFYITHVPFVKMLNPKYLVKLVN